MIVNVHHRKMLEAIFARPVAGNLRGRDGEALPKTPPPRVRAGSRVVVLLNDKGAVFQRSHPSQYMDKGGFQDVQRFLKNAGVAP